MNITIPIILNYNSNGDTIDLVKQLYNYKKYFKKIVIVDNLKDKETQSDLVNSFHEDFDAQDFFIIEENNLIDKNNSKNESFIHLILTNYNYGYARGNNLGFKYIIDNEFQNEFFIILNPDLKIVSFDINKLVKLFKDDHSLSILGSKLIQYHKNELKLQGLGAKVYKFFGAIKIIHKRKNPKLFKADLYYQYDYPIGAFLFLKRTCVEELNGFNPKLFMYGEELDLCIRAKKIGHKFAITGILDIIHAEGKSTDNKVNNFNKEYHLAYSTLLIFKTYYSYFYLNSIFTHLIRSLLKLIKGDFHSSLSIIKAVFNSFNGDIHERG